MAIDRAVVLDKLFFEVNREEYWTNISNNTSLLVKLLGLPDDWIEGHIEEDIVDVFCESVVSNLEHSDRFEVMVHNSKILFRLCIHGFVITLLCLH